jgi:hypothetical protein
MRTERQRENHAHARSTDAIDAHGAVATRTIGTHVRPARDNDPWQLSSVNRARAKFKAALRARG